MMCKDGGVNIKSLGMSPRELPNSVQVAPGRYVGKNPEKERAYYNKIRRESRERARSGESRFSVIEVDKILWE